MEGRIGKKLTAVTPMSSPNTMSMYGPASIWNYKSTKHAIFVAPSTAGGRFEMSTTDRTAEIIPYPTAGGAHSI